MALLGLPNNPLETLLRNLLLCVCNCLRCVRVLESTPELAILKGGCLSRAYTFSERRHFGTACRAAISIRDTSTSDELRAISSPNILGASVVGGDLGSSHGRNWTGIN
jgi:hypothetical protein